MRTVTAPLRAVLKTVGLIQTPGKPPAALPGAQRDDARAEIDREDELRRRRGGAADLVTGASGAEAPTTGGKQTLGS